MSCSWQACSPRQLQWWPKSLSNITLSLDGTVSLTRWIKIRLWIVANPSMLVTLSRAIFLDRKNRNNAIKEARHAAENIHKKKVIGCGWISGTWSDPLTTNIDQCISVP